MMVIETTLDRDVVKNAPNYIIGTKMKRFMNLHESPLNMVKMSHKSMKFHEDW